MVRLAARLNPDLSRYQQIEAVLRDQIADGVLRAGDRLPAEEDLCRQFNVSRGPVRQALEALDRDRLIERTPGRGTFVRAAPARRRKERGIIPWAEAIQAGTARATRLTRTGRAVPPPVVSRALSLAGDVEVSFFIRLFAGGSEIPVGVKRYVHPSLTGGTDRLAGSDDFERTLEEAAGGRSRIGAIWVEAILAEPRFAMQLKVPLGSPLLSTWWVDVVDGRPVACTQMLQPGSAIAVAIPLQGGADVL
jgi:GntR family transcriptional regulator